MVNPSVEKFADTRVTRKVSSKFLISRDEMSVSRAYQGIENFLLFFSLSLSSPNTISPRTRVYRLIPANSGYLNEIRTYTYKLKAPSLERQISWPILRSYVNLTFVRISEAVQNLVQLSLSLNRHACRDFY